MTTPPLYGLVLCGGHSRRMGQDKGNIQYHGIPQVQYVYQLLMRHCVETYVSCRQEQCHQPAYQGLPYILDSQSHQGPMAGVYAACLTCPKAAWIVLACDMPLVDHLILETLIQHRQPEKIATAFYHAESQFVEPLCAIYEPTSRMLMQQSLELGIGSLSQLLAQHPVERISVTTPEKFSNLNTLITPHSEPKSP